MPNPQESQRTGLTVCCHHCETAIADPDDARTVDHQPTCEGCTGTCDSCGDYCLADDLATVRTRSYRAASTAQWCPSCVADESFTCADCSETFTSSCSGGNNPSGDQVCERCSEEYSSCESCGCALCSDDVIVRDSSCYCEDCDPGDDGGESPDGVDGYGHTRASYFVTSKGVRSTPLDKTLYLGVELEVEVSSPYSLSDAADATRSRFGSNSYLVALKEDGSLNYGFEIVTQPADLDYQRTLWERFFADPVPGLLSFNTKTCGLHVHVSRAPLSELQTGKILAFVNANQNRKFVERLAQRNTERWAKIYDKKVTDAGCRRAADRLRREAEALYASLSGQLDALYARENTCYDRAAQFRRLAEEWSYDKGAYVQPMEVRQHLIDLARHLENSVSRATRDEREALLAPYNDLRSRADRMHRGTQESRYEAVNLQNEHTIEFRIFKGTLRKSSFFRALEFADAVVRFCRPAARSLAECLLLESFIGFVAKESTRYPNLHAFCLTRKWEDPGPSTAPVDSDPS